MSHFNIFGQGEDVHLSFASTASATAPQQMTLLDANMNIRTLKASERLVIDDMQASISAGLVDVSSASTVASSTLIAGLGSTGGPDFTAKEGISLPIGVVPWVVPQGSASTAVIRITGNGRIVEGSTTAAIQVPGMGIVGRPNWREALTPGGNF